MDEKNSDSKLFYRGGCVCLAWQDEQSNRKHILDHSVIFGSWVRQVGTNIDKLGGIHVGWVTISVSLRIKINSIIHEYHCIDKNKSVNVKNAIRAGRVLNNHFLLLLRLLKGRKTMKNKNKQFYVLFSQRICDLRMIHLLFMLIMSQTLVGCASFSVKSKINGKTVEGIPYYFPKTYLLVTKNVAVVQLAIPPASKPAGKKKTGKKMEGNQSQSPLIK